MQIVGKACEVCGKRIDTELDGVPCLECAIFFHDACALQRQAEAATPDSDGTAAPPRKSKKASRKVPCPWCGVDARKAHRLRLAAQTAERDAFDEDRRVAAARHADPGAARNLPLRFGISLLVFTVLVFLRVCAHR